MSKKRLDRTAIEGGRTSWNKWERRNSLSSERRSDTEFCHRLSIDPHLWYDSDELIYNREKVYKIFNDKLGPMYRWLHKQVGKLWNDVKSEAIAKFNSRTIAGRHILYDHLFSSVEEVPDLSYRRYHGAEDVQTVFTTSRYSNNEFYVDDKGILQNKKYTKINNSIPKFDTNSIANWLAGRAVGKVGNKMFWFTPTTKNKKRGGTNRKWKTSWGTISRPWYDYGNRYGLYFSYLFRKPVYKKNDQGILEIIGYEEAWQICNPLFKQFQRLSAKELKFWNSIPKYYQDEILKHSPLSQ